MMARTWTEKCTRPVLRIGIPLALLVVAIGWEVLAAKRLDAVIMKRGEIIYVQTVKWMRDHASRNAIVLTRLGSGSFCYYSDLATVRYDLAGPENLEHVYAAAENVHRPIYAAIADPETTEAFSQYLRGNWEQQVRFGMFVIWKRTAPIGDKQSSAVSEKL